MPIRVLLADDHMVVREGLRLLLDAQPDITVLGEAADGRAAVRAAMESCPDVIVMDIAMSGLNGIDATRQARAACPGIQVIVLSMHSNEEYVVRAFQAGALGYVVKEAAAADLVQAVRAAYNGQRYLSPKIAKFDQRADQKAGQPSPLGLLSAREREVLQLLVEGKSSVQIAGVMGLSPKTVETYRSRLMHKLGIDDLPSLVKFALQHGLTWLE
jgi:DNA-binding NarL/FixJ family response regulator